MSNYLSTSYSDLMIFIQLIAAITTVIAHRQEFSLHPIVKILNRLLMGA